MQIFLKNLQGKTLTFEVQPDERIEDFRVKVHQKTKVRPESQRLLFGSIQLENGHTLQDYNIQKETTLHLMVRCSGPPPPTTIIVQTAEGRIITVPLGPICLGCVRIGEVMKRIKKIAGIPTGMQHLFLNGKELKNKPLMSYGIKTGKTILTLEEKSFENPIRSPFPNVSHLLWNTRTSFPDVSIEIPGQGSHLYHRCVIAFGSRTILDLLSGRTNEYGTYYPDSQTIQWSVDCSDDKIYPIVFTKCLRVCYGESLNLTHVEYAPAYCCVTQLQMKKNKIGRMELPAGRIIKERMLIDSAADYKTGLAILNSCFKYKECRDVSVRIAEIVFTLDNILSHTQEIEECLMRAPPYLLCHAQFGEEHTDFSESAILKYLKANSSLSDSCLTNIKELLRLRNTMLEANLDATEESEQVSVSSAEELLPPAAKKPRE